MDTIFSNCTSGGCGAKIGPGELRAVLDVLHTPPDENLLVGYATSDDAAVYRLGLDSAIVSTLDFFPPVVDDPFHFGRIAAANALSDVYAMGGRPIFALNIVCFPEKMDTTVLADILRGGASILTEAGIPLAGGHSIYDQGIKYGLAVTGLVKPDRILCNTGCQAGDMLILTKPLGVGIVLAAHRVELADGDHYMNAVASMERLNKYAAEAAARFVPTACTDVTGFGLLVHLSEMAGTDVSLEVWPDALPVLPGACRYAEEYLLTAAGQRNRHFMENEVDRESFSTVAEPLQEVMLDPQTSGGLLFAVPEADADALLAALRTAEPDAAIIGTVLPRQTHPIRFGQRERSNDGTY